MAKMMLDQAGRDWLKKHNACEEGYKWAAYNCATMADVFATARPDWCVWVATRDGAMSKRDSWSFALWCAEQVRHLMTDTRSTGALDVRRRWIDGNATDAEMAAAWDAAWDAARVAAWDAARDAERDWQTRHIRAVLRGAKQAGRVRITMHKPEEEVRP